MKVLITTILSFFIINTVTAQCNNCTYSINSSNFDQNAQYMNSTTLCITGSMSINNMNFNGSGNVICIANGVALTGSFNPGNVTFNIYGTFNFSGNVNSNVIFNIQSGGTLNFTGNNLNAGTINNSGTLLFSNTGQVTVQGVTINNNTGGVITATAPSKVLVNNGAFTNSGTATFTDLENQEGNFTNNSGATITFQQGTFQHGDLHNNGSLIVNCQGYTGDCSSGNPCMSFGNKTSGQFSNSGSLSIHGSLCMGAQVNLNNSGTISIDGNLNLSSGATIAQMPNSSTTVAGSTSVATGSDLSGGTLCSNGVNGTVSATISCGSPAVISDITASTCKGVSLTIPIAATAPSGASVTWSTLKLINGTDTVLATATNHTLTTTNGTFTTSYTSSAASVLFVPVSTYTGTTTIKYRIAALSGSTTTYADPKNINVTVTPKPTKPQAIINP
jgi:hypothetical protein